LRIRIGLTLAGLAVAVGGSTFVLASAAAGRKDPNLVTAEAFVDKQCPADTREISTAMWQAGWRFNALYGNCRAGDGSDQHAWFFDRGRFVGTNARTASLDIIGLWRNNTTIALLYVLYRHSDPDCCATGGGAIVRYRLEKGHVRRLDPLPPQVSKRGVRIGR
jgi:LppP/LprE lipoprotein